MSKVNKSWHRQRGSLETNSTSSSFQGVQRWGWMQLSLGCLSFIWVHMAEQGTLLARPIKVPKNVFIILAGPCGPSDKCEKQAERWILASPIRANKKLWGSHTCTCLSPGLSLGDGVPGSQVGVHVGSGHWFPGLGGVTWLWTASGSSCGPYVLWLPGKTSIDMAVLSLCQRRDWNWNSEVIRLNSPAMTHP